MHSQIETKRVLIARNCDRTPGITAANMYNNLGAGELIITDEKGNILNTSAKAKSAKAIRIFQGLTSGGYSLTDLITKDKISRYEGFKFKQSKEQRVAIGYNGTAGSIEVFDDNTYSFTVEYDNTGASTHNDMEIHKVTYKSPYSNTTQFIVANELVKLFTSTLIHIRDFGIKVNVVTSDAGAAGLTGCEVIRGSKVVQYTAGSPAVDDVFKFAGLTGTPYRDEVDSVYKVTAVDTVAKTVTLDKPFQNADQTGVAAAKIADTSVANYGIVIEGTINDFLAGEGDYIKTLIGTELQRTGFGSTTYTDTGVGFEMFPGNGRHESVGLEEFYYQANQRNAEVSKEYATYSKETLNKHGYSGITIDFYSNDKISIVESNGSLKSVTIFLDRGTYTDVEANNANTSFKTCILTGSGADSVDGVSLINVLNAFMVGAGVITTGINTKSNEGMSLMGSGTYGTGIDL